MRRKRFVLLHLYGAACVCCYFRELLRGSTSRHCCKKKRSIGVNGVVATLSLYGSDKQQTYRGAFVFPGNHLYIFTSWILTDRSSCSSSSFRFMAVHSLGVLPPPTVYLAHMIVVLGAQLFFLSWVARMLPCEYLT